MITSVQYEILLDDDLDPLIEKMKARGEIEPDKELMAAFVAKEGDRIVAEIAIQKVNLVEPATAEEGYGEHLGHLFKMAQGFILGSEMKRVLMHPEHTAMKAMLRRAGAKVFAEFWQWVRG